MKIYIAIKYNKKSLELVPGIREIIKKAGSNSYCFAEEEGYIEDEKEMMKLALKKIDESDLIIVEASNSSFGVGIEAGYAFAKNKRIVTIMNESEETSNTLKGISDSYFTYSNFEELEKKLCEIL